MKWISLCLLQVLFTTTLFAQKKEEVIYSDAFQIDSSDHFVIPRLLDDENRNAYGKGKGYLPWGVYTNVIFYNAKENRSQKLFTELALVQPFFARRHYFMEEKQPETPANILQKHIVYMATTQDFNSDRALDNEDPVYLYISSKNGENLRQITPSGFHVISWTASKDRKMLLVRGLHDKNGNKKFGNGDDNLYYRVDLDDDISKIKCYQLKL